MYRHIGIIRSLEIQLRLAGWADTKTRPHRCAQRGSEGPSLWFRMKHLSIELYGICDQVTSSGILDHNLLGRSTIRAAPEGLLHLPPNWKKNILLNHLFPTVTLEGDPLLGELCKVWRAWGQGSNVGRWQELSKRGPTIILSLNFQRQSICHVEEKQSSSSLPQGTLCIPCNTPVCHIVSLPAFPPLCIAAQWPMLFTHFFCYPDPQRPSMELDVDLNRKC